MRETLYSEIFGRTALHVISNGQSQ